MGQVRCIDVSVRLTSEGGDSYFGNSFEITLKVCLKAGGAFLQCFLEGRLDSSHSRPLISADLRAIARINRLPARSDRPRTQICNEVPGHSTKTTPLSSSGEFIWGQVKYLSIIGSS